MTEKREIQLVELDGSLEVGNAPELRHQLQTEVESGSEWVIIDLSRVTFIDSSCLGILVVAYKTTRRKGGVIKFANPSSQVRQIFDLTRLSQHVEIYDSLAECEESFV
ncbi:MAG: STAS domain-containing protein [Calditrichia bacterium]